MGGTIVKDGLTTVHETSVIGTYINGKYAQVLQSASKILKPGVRALTEEKIRASNSQKILKTIGPQHGKLKPQLEPTPAIQQQGESSLPLEGLFHSPGTFFQINNKTSQKYMNFFFRLKCLLWFSKIGQSNTKPVIKDSVSHSVRPKFKSKMLEDGENFDPSQQLRNSNKNRPGTTRPSYK